MEKKVIPFKQKGPEEQEVEAFVCHDEISDYLTHFFLNTITAAELIERITAIKASVEEQFNRYHRPATPEEIRDAQGDDFEEHA